MKRSSGTRRGLALLVLCLLGSGAAQAAPLVVFTASRTERCVAPCAVFFDATPTTDPSAKHPFHDLDFRWEFGDEHGETWALSGQPKDRAIGGIAGHLFTRPGLYTVTLHVSNAAGESASAQKAVVVGDPATSFAGANTTCVSASGSFDGCPDGAQHVRSGDFASALANAPGRRTLLRRGESFAWSRPVRLADAPDGGAALGVFGPGSARATLRAGSGVMLDPGDDWRVSHLELRGPGANVALAAITEHGGVRRFTLEDVAVRGFNNCADFWSPTRPNEQIAFVDVSCGEFPDPGNGAKFYEDTQESMFLGLDLDKGDHRDPRDQTEFAYRTVFSQKKLIQHGRFRGRAPNQSKNLLQLRHCPTAGPWRVRCEDGKVPSRYVIVSDNQFVEGGGPHALTVIRVCDHGSCTGAPGESQAVEDYVFERNLFQIDARDGASDQMASIFELQATRTSVRDNVADLQGWPRGGPPRAFFALVEPLSNPQRDGSGEIWIHHNTLYFDPGSAKPIVLCAERGNMSGLECANNLVYAPGAAGAVTPSMGEGWRDTGNRVATGNPFPKAPPARLQATLRDLGAFRVGTGRPAAGAAIEPAAPAAARRP